MGSQRGRLRFERGIVTLSTDSSLGRANFTSPADGLGARLCHIPNESVFENLGNSRKGAEAWCEG